MIVGTFSFSSKDNGFCFYEIDGKFCPLSGRPAFFTILSELDGFAYVQQPDANGDCPASVSKTYCTKKIKLIRKTKPADR